MAACLALFLAGLASVNWADAQGGILGATAIFALVAMGRRMTQRLAPATVR
jgi:urea transporter